MSRRSRERAKKGEKTKQILMSVFLAVVMIFSVFGILIGTQSDKLSFGGHDFKVDQNRYTTKIDGKELYFYTLPYEVQYINVSDSAMSKIKNSVYMLAVFNPAAAGESLPAIEIVRFDFVTLLTDKFFYSGVEEPSPLYTTLPTLSCANASAQAPAIIFNVSESSSIVEDGNCIYLNGQGVDFLRFRDRILYDYYGVYEDAEGQ
ncbi:hypothetical protein JW711_00665 [Candidatus Woesearchaeota archaeon]|nr:hypothetical protein [Candidatus Woesearchaeota archaeon]